MSWSRGLTIWRVDSDVRRSVGTIKSTDSGCLSHRLAHLPFDAAAPENCTRRPVGDTERPRRQGTIMPRVTFFAASASEKRAIKCDLAPRP